MVCAFPVDVKLKRLKSCLRRYSYVVRRCDPSPMSLVEVRCLPSQVYAKRRECRVFYRMDTVRLRDPGEGVFWTGREIQGVVQPGGRLPNTPHSLHELSDRLYQ